MNGHWMIGLDWIRFIGTLCVPLGIIVGMAAVLIRDHIRKKRREKRLHQPISIWEEYGNE